MISLFPPMYADEAFYYTLKIYGKMSFNCKLELQGVLGGDCLLELQLSLAFLRPFQNGGAGLKAPNLHMWCVLLKF